MPEDINTNIPKGVEKREFTGVWIPKEILDDSNLKAVDKILYAEISSFGQKGCWKKSEDLRNLTGVGVDAFRESCKRLRLGGYITEKRSFGRIIRTTTLGFSSKEKPITNEEENPCVERGGFYHRSGNPCDEQRENPCVEQRENPRVHIENSIENIKENNNISEDIGASAPITHKGKNKTSSTVVQLQEVIDYFNKVVDSNHKALPRLGAILKSRVKEGFSKEDIFKAIDNAKDNAFLMGDNPNGKRYLTPEYILRPDKLDEWVNTKKPKRKFYT